MAEKKEFRNKKLIVLGICGAITLGAAAFLAVQSISDLVKKQEEEQIPIIVAPSSPDTYQGTNGWYYIDSGNWSIYKKGNTSWNLQGYLYDMSIYNVDGKHASSPEDVYKLYCETLSEIYNYDCSFEQWLDDVYQERLLNRQEYLIKFYDEDNSLINTQTARLRETIEYSKNLPTKTASESGLYTFDSWTTPITSICSTFDTFAQYTEIPISSCLRLSGDGTYYEFVLSNFDSSSIKSIEIPNEINGVPITKLGEKAFFECEFLENIILPETITTIDGWSFQGCKNLKKFYISKNLVDISAIAFSWDMDSLEGFEVDPENPKFSVENDILYNKDFSELVRYPAGKKATFENNTYYVRETVTKVSSFGLNGIQNVDYIILPEAVYSIGSWAFGNSSIKSFKFNKNVKRIETDLFGGCKYIERFEVDEKSETFKEIDGVLFSKDGTTLLRHPTSLKIEIYEVPNTVKTIGAYAFNSCNIRQVVLPSGLESINYGAFSDCLNLIFINIPESVKTIMSSAFNRCVSIARMVNGERRKEILVPSTVEVIESEAFCLMDDVVIYVDCDESKKPLGWAKDFSTQPVVWGDKK